MTAAGIAMIEAGAKAIEAGGFNGWHGHRSVRNGGCDDGRGHCGDGD
jgi:hypothetical protein